jgi:hypothetical protein
MPGARRTGGLVRKWREWMRARAYWLSGGIRHPLRNGFTAYAALSSATNSSCHRRRRIQRLLQPGRVWICHRRLGTSNGCQDHTVLPYATTSFVLRACNRSRGSTRPATAIRADALASTTSHPAFVTTRDRPSCRNGTAAVKPLIWAFGEAKYCPSCHLAATRRARSEYLRHSGTRHFGAGPESITTDREYGFRARADARPGMTVFTLSLRANGSRECALDDRLREAIHGVTEAWIASSLIAPRNDG